MFQATSAAASASLAECPAATSGLEVAVAVGQPAKPLDYCTVKGVAGEPLEALVSGIKPNGACNVAVGCPLARHFCSLATQTRACTCANTTGTVTCEVFGQCEPDSCSVCADCVVGLQGYVQNVSAVESSAAVAEAFQATCAAKGSSALMCAASKTFIGSSNKGNLGRRAGAICSMLGRCRGTGPVQVTSGQRRPLLPGSVGGQPLHVACRHHAAILSYNSRVR